ncbi:MAG: FtsX-like permease family protein [Aigarchaeota archaeon]|nr:FtsX-like permease family protein [Aigarchaeota archaeon]MDW7986821.1 FtsX-like permease family protein [Nitrososphaerota archaeon]
MRLLDIILLAFSALKDRKLRTILTILGMVVGPAAYVAVISSTEGMSESIIDSLRGLGAEKIFVWRSARGTLDITDKMVQDISRIEGVKYAIPFYTLSAGQARARGMTIDLNPAETYSVLAMDFKDIDKIFPNVRLREGTIPLTGDSVALIGSKVSEPDSSDLPRINLGDTITIIRYDPYGHTKTHSTIVVGILDYYGQSFFYNPDMLIFVSRDVGRKLLGERSYTGIFVISEDPSMVEYVENKIKERFGGDVILISTKAILQTVQSVASLLSFFLASISSMSLIVAFLAIMATMFTAVTERIREIGLLKALGFKTKHVLFMFLMEAALIGLIGGAIGVAVGSVGAYILAQPSPTEEASEAGITHVRGQLGFSPLGITYIPKITLELVLTAILIAFIVGILAGLLPAWRAAKYTPVEALRRE